MAIQRNHRLWSGGLTDQTIEQVLMHMLKARGGLAHGRDIMQGTQARLVYWFATISDRKHFITFNNYFSQDRFLTMVSIKTTLSLFLPELWRQTVLMQIVL